MLEGPRECGTVGTRKEPGEVADAWPPPGECTTCTTGMGDSTDRGDNPAPPGLVACSRLVA